jgi:osmotically-inducible protein OsmY
VAINVDNCAPIGISAACLVTFSRRTMKQTNSEAQLATAITSILTANDLAVSDLAVVFDSTIGTVTVSGGVSDPETAEKVGEVCGSFNGVKTVDASHLVMVGTKS